MRETEFEEQVAAAKTALERPGAEELKSGITASFEEEQEREWRDHVKDVAEGLVNPDEDNGNTEEQS